MKNKKLFKGLAVVGLTAVACLGMTGCGVNLTAEQADKIMTCVDSCDMFMDETLDLLTKSNGKLNIEDAWRLHSYSLARLKANDESIFKNLKIESYEKAFASEEWEQSHVSYFRTNSDKSKILANVPITENMDEAEIWIEYTESDNSYFEYCREGESKSLRKKNYTWIIYTADFPLLGSYELEMDDIVGCDILENGNYSIKYVQTVENKDIGAGHKLTSYLVAQEEVSADGLLISETVESVEIERYNGSISSQRTMSDKFVYKYGEVKDSDVQPYIKEIKAEITLNTPGDATGNGEVDIEDVTILQNYLNGTITNLSSEQMSTLDMNNDGNVDNIDLYLLKNYVNSYNEIRHEYGFQLPYTCLKFGDVNCDGIVNADDIAYLSGWYNFPYLEMYPLSTAGMLNADVNMDGDIDNIDLYLLKNYVNSYNEIRQEYGFQLPYTCLKFGDVNCDGIVNADDTAYLSGWYNFPYLETYPLSTAGMLNADVNMDGEINMDDVMAIQELYE